MKKSTIAIGAVLTLGLLTAGAGAATAATLSPSGAVPGATVTVGASSTPSSPSSSVEPNEPNDPNDPADSAAEANEPKDTNEAADSPETPGTSDGNDAGHSDPDGVDVQHTENPTAK